MVLASRRRLYAHGSFLWVPRLVYADVAHGLIAMKRVDCAGDYISQALSWLGHVSLATIEFCNVFET